MANFNKNTMGMSIDTTDLLDLAKLMLPGAQDNAMVKAINRVGEEARKLSQDLMTKEYNFKPADARIFIDRARRGSLFAGLSASRKRPSFMYFGAQPTPRGVSAQIQRSRKTSRKAAFIARPRGIDYSKRGQRRTVSSPVEIALQRKGPNAYPLRKLTGPSPGSLLKSKRNLKNINDMIAKRGSTIFHEEVEIIFNKKWSFR
jgi:hypothetical protein